MPPSIEYWMLPGVTLRQRYERSGEITSTGRARAIATAARAAVDFCAASADGDSAVTVTDSATPRADAAGGGGAGAAAAAAGGAGADGGGMDGASPDCGTPAKGCGVASVSMEFRSAGTSAAARDWRASRALDCSRSRGSALAGFDSAGAPEFFVGCGWAVCGPASLTDPPTTGAAGKVTGDTVRAGCRSGCCSRFAPIQMATTIVVAASGTSHRTDARLHHPRRDASSGAIRTIAASIAWQCAQSAACVSAADRSSPDSVPSIHAASTSGVRWSTAPQYHIGSVAIISLSRVHAPAVAIVAAPALMAIRY